MKPEEFHKRIDLGISGVMSDNFYRIANLGSAVNTLRQMLFEHIQSVTGQSNDELFDKYEKLQEKHLSLVLDSLATIYEKNPGQRHRY